MTLLAAGILQRFGDLLVVGVILAFTAYGAGSGIFLAVLAGMDALVSLVVALAFAKTVAAWLVAVEMPAAFAFPAAFGLLLVATAVGIRLAIGAWVPRDTVRFAPLIDQLGGGLVGAVAGMVVAGALLIAASIAPLPASFAIDGTQLRFDMGTRLLRTFARCVEPKEEPRGQLLDGEQPAAAATGLVCSELFADTNGNGQYDAGDAGDAGKERYIDADRNGAFTLQLPFADANANGKRDVGLLERYRLGAWEKAIVMHSPAISSADSATVPDDAEDGARVYQALATDLDSGDALAFGMRPAPPAGDATAAADEDVMEILAVDPTTGVVTLEDVEWFLEKKPPVRFTLTVTDSHGLAVEKIVALNRAPAKAGPAKRKPQSADK
jgi:hypothetical protein